MQGVGVSSGFGFTVVACLVVGFLILFLWVGGAIVHAAVLDLFCLNLVPPESAVEPRCGAIYNSTALTISAFAEGLWCFNCARGF